LKGSANQTTAVANARAEAQSFAKKNYGGGVALTLDANTSNDSAGDIVCGYLSNPSNLSQAMNYTAFPNSLQVRVHRDSTRNGPLSLFFGRALGLKSLDLQATATATYQGGIQGFKIQVANTTSKLLPFALDVNTWNNVVAGSGPDNFSRNAATGTVTAGSDGVHECKLYPLTNGAGNSQLPPGNFGTVDIGAPNNSTADLVRQIQYGPNATDLSYFPNSTVQVNPATGTLILQGDTGISAGITSALTSIIGQPRIIPLYSSASGNGNNCNYTIVGFAGIAITEVVLTGPLSDKHITIQPAFCLDGNTITSGSGLTSPFVYRPLALTR
jgi:hypothetical protein